MDASAGKSKLVPAAVILILLGSFCLKLHHLDHAALKPLDEVFHAIVARNLMKHPLTPTLVDQPYLPYDATNWQGNFIWLHKPPMALWQIALSYAIFGVGALGLRLPSAILSTAAAGLTYLIGVELLDATAGLIAAAFQAFNPVLLMLVQGYVFSDHVDISLLFWTELSIYFLARTVRTGQKSAAIICGIAQGLAFLSKSYPALIVSGVALVAWLLPQVRLRRRTFFLILLATAATAFPWTLYSAVRFPTEVAHENAGILSHLDQNVEGWAAPWDRVLFGYWISIFHVYYPLVLAATVILIVRAIHLRERGLLIVLAWAGGTLVPNLLAQSKPMTATLVGWPAMWLLMGYMISLALKGNRWALGTWAVAMLLAATTLNKTSIPLQGWGMGTGFASIMLAHMWVIWQAATALAIGAVWRWARKATLTVAIAGTILLAVQFWPGNHPTGYAIEAGRVTQLDKTKPSFQSLGRFAANLPANAAFLVVERDKLENKLIEFAADRSCYPWPSNQDWHTPATALVEAGALPYLVVHGPAPLPVVFVDTEDECNVYACSPAAFAAAGGQ
jgi:4-amino-4-deoxy-L-arabinose transferase-like glycosyltransferase